MSVNVTRMPSAGLLSLFVNIMRRLKSGNMTVCRGLNRGQTKFVKTKDLLYREFTKGNKATLQLVVPEGFRGLVLRLAHKTLMSGHLGTKKKLDRVVAVFFWPRICEARCSYIYILTMIDYARRYSEAVALPSIETERVAVALVEMFSRVGTPDEMLTDCGSLFTAEVIKEVSRLLLLQQLTTTSYHPMCHGLVERFDFYNEANATQHVRTTSLRLG